MTSVSTDSRFQAWAALFAFSCVCLLAHLTSIVEADTSTKWVTAALSISLILNFFAVLAHFFVKDNKFVGQLIEGGTSLLLLIFWCACLPTIMSPSRNIVVSGMGQGVIQNSNLYFFSWISFACVLYITGDCFQEISGRQFKTVVSQKNNKWCGLFADSIVVLAAASMIHIDLGCVNSGWDVDVCLRTNYAVALGILGVVFSAIAFVAIAMGKSNVIERIIAAVMFVMYTFGVGFITFGSGPATTLGNLYFSTWIGFAISLFLLLKSCEELNAARNVEGSKAMNSAPSPALGDIDQQESPNDDVEIGAMKSASAPALADTSQQESPNDDVEIGAMKSAPAPALADISQQEGPNDDVETSLGK